MACFTRTRARMRWADTQAAEGGAVSFLALNETGRDAVAPQPIGFTDYMEAPD